MRRYALSGLYLLLAGGVLRADGPQDNATDKARPVPPPGVTIADADRAELTKGVAALRQEIDKLHAAVKEKPALVDLLPDVEIFANAVHYALKYNEFFNPAQVG